MIRKETRELMYKSHRVLYPYCTVCGEFLSGNNSMVSPYKCKCGTWKQVIGDDYLPVIRLFELIK